MHFKIPLNNLNTFACAARLESFQHAAEQLHISPSAVSHQIRNLEQLLDYKLFDRLDKQVKLTEQGLDLFQVINQPLHLLYQASEQALQPQLHRLNISCAPIFATRWLMPRLSSFQACHPEIEITIHATTEKVDLYQGQIDGVIRHGLGNWPELMHQPLLPEQPVIVCRPSFLKKLGGPLTPEQLMSQPLVDISAHTDRWEEWFADNGIKANRSLCVMKVQNSAQAIETSQMSDMFSLQDRNMIEKDLAEGSLVIACEQQVHSPFGYYLLWPRDSAMKPALKQFKVWLLAQLSQAQTDGSAQS